MTSEFREALDYLDDMTGRKSLDIPGGRSPVMFAARYEIAIRRALLIADRLMQEELRELASSQFADIIEPAKVIPQLLDLLDQMAGAAKVVIDQCNDGDGFTEQAALDLAGALAAYNKMKGKSDE